MRFGLIRVFWLACVFAGLAACSSGGSGWSSGGGCCGQVVWTPSPAPSYMPAFSLVDSFGLESPQPYASPIILFGGSTPASFFHAVGTLALAVQPAPPGSAFVWSSTDSDLMLSDTDPQMSPDNATLPGRVFITPRTYRAAKATVGVTAASPLPIALTATLDVYPAESVGCGLRDHASVSFNDDGTRSESPAAPLDWYASSSTPQTVQFPDTGNGCTAPPFLGSDAIHVPYGGTLVPGNLADFPAVRAAQWRNDFTSVPIGTGQLFGTTGIFVFKTHTGAIVKALNYGPYQVARGWTSRSKKLRNDGG